VLQGACRQRAGVESGHVAVGAVGPGLFSPHRRKTRNVIFFPVGIGTVVIPKGSG